MGRREPKNCEWHPGYKRFSGLLQELLLTLAKMIVRDGEGTTKVVESPLKMDAPKQKRKGSRDRSLNLLWSKPPFLAKMPIGAAFSVPPVIREHPFNRIESTFFSIKSRLSAMGKGLGPGK